MLNKIVLMGRLTKDPELRYTHTSSIPVAGFSLAVDRKIIKDRDKETDFFDIVAWQGTAEFVSKYFVKGQQMCVEGRLQQRKWADSEGKTRYAYEVIAESVYFAGRKADGVQNGEADYSTDFDPFENAA